jgi:hypothetical protein
MKKRFFVIFPQGRLWRDPDLSGEKSLTSIFITLNPDYRDAPLRNDSFG